MMLSADDLAGMRATQDDALPDTATIARPTRTTDGAGGYTTVLTTILTGIACRLAKSRPREILAGDREVTYSDWVVTFPYATDVRAGDVLTISTRTYNVLATAAGSWNTAVRAYCIGAE